MLHECGARELGLLNCASKYFTATGINERVARRRVEDHPRADGVEVRPKENFARLLHFADAADVATRTAAGLSLGAFHTAVLGIAGALPGVPPAACPVRRRTDARDFASRRGLGDDDDARGGGLYRWGDAPGGGGGYSFPVPSEDDEKDEHGMSVFAPISEGFNGSSGHPSTIDWPGVWKRGGDRAVAAANGRASWKGVFTEDREAITPAAAAAAWARAATSQPRGRTLYTFGRGFHGQLGQGGYDDASVPAAVSLSNTGFADPTAVESISCGASHCAALDPDGVLLTWGLASSGELGHGGWTPIEVDVPRQVTSMAHVKVKQIAAGANHTVVVSRDGGLWSCGRGRHGQLGHGHFHDAGPLQRLEALRGMSVLYAVAGGSHSLCLTDCGSVWSWGAHRRGQLGLGDVAFATAAGWESGVPWPCLVESLNDLDEPVVTMAAGGHHTLFVTAGGQLWAAGRGEHGALGVGVKGTHRQYYYYEEDQNETVRGPADHLLPRLVPVHHKPAPPVAVQRAGAGARARAAPNVKRALARGSSRADEGAAAACGSGRKRGGEGGGGGGEEDGFGEALARRQSMRASCGGPTGFGGFGQNRPHKTGFSAKTGPTSHHHTIQAASGVADAGLGTGGKKATRWVKVPCSCGASCRVVHAAAGGNHSAVLTACGAVMTTGSNAYGQLGHGDTRKRYAFARVESLRGERVATVATGEDHSGAVSAGGGLYLWGRGDWGQLGTGDGRSHWLPRAVTGVNVAPPVALDKYLGFADVPEAQAGDEPATDDADGEMGGGNQHLHEDEHAAAVY